MKVTLTFEDCTPAEAAHLLTQAGGQAPITPPLGGGAPSMTPPSPGPTGAPPPPPPAGAQTGVATASHSNPPPPPPTGAAPPPRGGRNVAQGEVLAAMSYYSALGFKASGVKKVLEKCGLAKPTDANQDQANWLYDVFQAGQAV